MKQPKKPVEIPQIIYTDQFLRFVAAYANKFKANKGYGRWLVEYKSMEAKGMFEPKKLRELYIKILDGSNTLSYIYWDAVNSICVQALDATEAYISAATFDIRVITGEIATDDNGKELTNLSIKEAISVCNTMNEEAEELLFMVYNSVTNKSVKYAQKNYIQSL